MDNEKSKPRTVAQMVLVVSLALNVAVVGVVAGMALSGRSHAGPPQRMSFEFGALGRILDRDDRRAIGEAMRRNGPRPLSRDAVQLQLGAIAGALRAEPFDPDALTGLIAELRDRSTRVQQNAQAAFVAHLTAMSVAERATLADKLERGKP